MITKTQHNVVMSPRMSRLWTFIREERRISLTDFSTDQCVERAQSQLREGEKILVERAAKAPDDKAMQDLLGDYQHIMNRRPSTRVTEGVIAAGAVKGKGEEGRDEIAEKINRGRW